MEKTIDAVNADDLDVPYSIGKRFDEEKGIVNGDLELVEKWARAVTEDNSGIFDEVNFLLNVSTFQDELGSFSTLLVEFDFQIRLRKRKRRPGRISSSILRPVALPTHSKPPTSTQQPTQCSYK